MWYHRSFHSTRTWIYRNVVRTSEIGTILPSDCDKSQDEWGKTVT